MPQLRVIYWRDIPAQVIAKDGREECKRELPRRFAVAIDAAAMGAGATGDDAYLAGWRKSDPESTGDGDPAALEALVDGKIAALDAEYDTARLSALVDNGGRDAN